MRRYWSGTTPIGGSLQRGDGSGRSKARLLALTSFLLASLFLFGACSSEGAPSTLDPAGEGSRRIEGIWWFLFWASVVAVAVVTALLLLSLRRARWNDLGAIEKDKPRLGEPFVVVAGVVIPALVLIGTYVFSLKEMNALATSGEGTELEITVSAQNWWWEVEYPNGAETANEIHIPAGEPVRLILDSPDVVHSFWVPRLQAKMDHIPGESNELWLEADSPGRFRGQCAEFCGLQHAHMAFYVVAQTRSDFDEWVERQAEPAATPEGTAADGESVFLSSTCVGCHAVRGTEAESEIGPDLTHLADRETIAAGKLENTRDNLEEFVLDPQGVKPGVGMPPTDLDEEELEALLDYLEQLD
jgi:cytochrome c oxidase subunit 2